jgi:hypothetical protein
MVGCMALMIAINVGVMVYKSVKEARRQKRLKAVKKRNLEKFNQEIEVKTAIKTFDITSGLRDANKLWR